MKKHENQSGGAEWEIVYAEACKIPTTITQLRRAMPGWRIEYGQCSVYPYGEKRIAHRISAKKKVNWEGCHSAVPTVMVRLTDKMVAIRAAYAAMKAMEADDA